jgi:hypothetical protein
MNDKPKKPRRTRVDSVAGVAAAIVAGGKKIVVPSNVTFTAKQRLIFTELCDEFSKAELTAHKIRLLACLAKEMAMLEEQQDLLRTEGSVFVNSHGNPTANPRAKAVQSLTNATLALRRSLGVHARELAGGDNRRTGIRRAHNKANEAMMDEIDPDGLLSRPNVVPISGRSEDDDDDS